MYKSLIAACFAVALTLAAFAQKEHKKERQTAQLNFVVVRESNGKPVRNAEIVLHLLDKDGKQKQESLELKTHEDGKAETTGIPYGKVRIQVIASGFRTYGEDYDIKDASLDVTIKMQKPADQFSIYK